MPWPPPACSDHATPTPSTPGWTATSARASTALPATPTEGTTALPFADVEAVAERLRQGPGARRPAAGGPPARDVIADLPTRWTLESIQAAFDFLADYSTSGVWRWLQRLGFKHRSAVVQQFSPDPLYAAKVAELEMCLWEARRYPRSVVAVFLDEMGFSRWPEPAPDWGPEARVADRQGANNGLWRLIGALNPFTGQVNFLDGYIVGRAKVIDFYGPLAAAYPRARRLYMIQDNWSIHKHPDVLGALQGWPQVEPVWLPTYAPWLNPMEKVWRWLRQDILKMHRQAEDWVGFRQRVRTCLGQFAQGSLSLLESVGLLGSGRLARLVHGP
jgi:transposase